MTVHLAWTRPDLESLRRQGFRVSRFDVYRATSPVGRAELGEAAFDDRAQRVGSISAEAIDRRPAQEPVSFLDRPERSFGRQLWYGVRMVSESGKTGTLSNLVQVLMEAAVPEPPDALEVSDQGQDRVLLQWLSPSRNIDGSSPARVAGYGVYRRDPETEPKWTSLSGPTPIPGRSFVDRTFQYGRKYEYTVRAVTPGRAGDAVESGDAVAVEHLAKDSFPPSSPEGLTAGSANRVVNLFWASGSETDLDGYYVYRSVASEMPSQWIRRNEQLHPLTTFRDERTVRGTVYRYRVTAVDRAGNESPPSAEVVQEVN